MLSWAFTLVSHHQGDTTEREWVSGHLPASEISAAYLWKGMRGCQQKSRLEWTWQLRYGRHDSCSDVTSLPVTAVQPLYCVTLLCLPFEPTVDISLPPWLWAGLCDSLLLVECSCRHMNRGLEYACMALLGLSAFAVCHEQSVPEVAAGPRMKDTWSFLAPTCGLILSHPVYPSTSEKEMSVVTSIFSLSLWLHSIIIAEVWPVQQTSWLLYLLCDQKTGRSQNGQCCRKWLNHV